MQMGIDTSNCRISQFHSAEDGDTYDVWRVEIPEGIRVLKRAKASEAQIYSIYFSSVKTYAPQVYAVAEYNGESYLLMEYIPGNDMSVATRDTITMALNSLIAMQMEYWQKSNTLDSACATARTNRRNYLKNATLEQAYDIYLSFIQKMPLTLCHDDLLPFNVMISDKRAVLIDWEVGGILPYPTSLARLIAHSSSEPDAFFYISDADKAFAIDYYYANLPVKMGISRSDFDRDLALCMLYEYCEWVYVGNKYPDGDKVRYQSYLKKALQQAKYLETFNQ